MNEKVDKLLASLSLEEKCALLSGADEWSTAAIGDVAPVAMSDGPHGLRKVQGSSSRVATCFPTLAALAGTWDTRRAADIGGAIASEAAASGVNVVLGPGVNIKRSPLGGRNFEYLSEDPYLTGRMAVHYINGMQAQGIGASVKHFAMNSQETDRLRVSAEVDERTLMEIYLPAFEAAVREASPWTVMCAYNRLGGVFCSENRRLLTEILREKWGYEGTVVSDWGAAVDRVEGVRAGMDLEMPGPSASGTDALVRAVREGSLSEEAVDRCARRVIELSLKASGAPAASPPKNHHMTARRCAAEGMVLAKNEGSLLPLIPAQRVALIGPYGTEPVIQGGGSSRVNAERVDIPLEEMRVYDPPVFYAKGFRTDGAPDEALFQEALATAAKADVVVVMVGLPDGAHTEGADRTTLALPDVQNRLVEELCARHERVVAVVTAGGPVELPWADSAKAILIAYLSGQGMGGAVADVLYGIKEPSGRLAETWPARLEDTPSYQEFPGGSGSVRYGEGVFVGYRWYDKRQIRPLFPFGHGISYTTFSYTDIKAVQDGNDITISLKVTNTGSRTGRPVVQLYIAPLSETYVPRPVQELKGFAKCRLSSGESTVMTFQLDAGSFSYYDVEEGRWRAEAGTYEVRLGTSSRVFFHRKRFTIPGDGDKPFTVHSTLQELLPTPAGDELRAALEAAGIAAPDEFMLRTPLRRLALYPDSRLKLADCEAVIRKANEKVH